MSTRPDPGFDVIISLHGAEGRTFISPRLAAALQDVYDTAVNSMDFGSGFLDTEEIENLRILGGAIGAEPLHYQCDQRDGHFVERVCPEHRNHWEKFWVEPVPCTCGALNGPVVDGEVVPERKELEG